MDHGKDAMPKEFTSLSLKDYLWSHLEFGEKVILDAGTGLLGTTSELVERVIAAGGTSQIITIDIADKLPQVKSKFVEQQHLVGFVQADLSCMPQIADKTVDIVACTDTLCMLSAYPLRGLKVLSEFRRVLKSDAHLVIGEQMPTPKGNRPQEAAWALRWQLIKALHHLQGKPHLEEIHPDDLEFALKQAGFKGIRWAVFSGEAQSEPWEDIEWGLKRVVEQIDKLDDSGLQEALQRQVERIREVFRNHGGLFLPYYVMHATV